MRIPEQEWSPSIHFQDQILMADEPSTFIKLISEKKRKQNELVNDKSYLNDGDSLEGDFFMSFLSLYLYYSMFVLVLVADLIGRMYVKDVLMIISTVYKIIRGNKEILSEILSSIEKIYQPIGTNIFPKKLRS